MAFSPPQLQKKEKEPVAWKWMPQAPAKHRRCCLVVFLCSVFSVLSVQGLFLTLPSQIMLEEEAKTPSVAVEDLSVTSPFFLNEKLCNKQRE